MGVVHPEDRGLVRNAVDRSADAGGDFRAEYRIVRPADGAVRWVVARGRPHPATLAHGWRLMGVSTDITDRKRVEEELTRSLVEIKQLKDRLEAESNYLSQEIKSAHGHDRIVGQSPAIRRSLAQVELVAAANTTVLLLGETGTGKELFASAIHETSPRRDRTMVRINCAAMPVALIESELFGREKGAYTGALSRQVGRFELAHRSTLFLDEVGELPLELQVKLLRVLEERQIERLGSPKPIPVDIRLVAATNRDLERAVAEGKFREDLYYRLNVFQIRVPPLRDRRDDIPLLVRAFVGEFAGAQGKRIDSIDQADMAALQQYDWPGNVRELRNVIERAVITTAGPKLRVDPPAARPGPSDGRGQSLRIEDVERAHLTAVLERTGWRIRGDGGAAELLDLKPTTLESRMEKLGIARPR
ncbi:MAG TPA: sigma 54-interacting transcriptional regulator, partial [Humisphaera sp.]